MVKVKGGGGGKKDVGENDGEDCDDGSGFRQIRTSGNGMPRKVELERRVCRCGTSEE